MFVIKATLRDETRRLVFDGKAFPPYCEIQQKVRVVSCSSYPYPVLRLLRSPPGHWKIGLTTICLLTRRLFPSHRPCVGYRDISILCLLNPFPQIRTTFNLPSSTHTYWINVLLHPDDADEARIMFKQHVCDAAE